MFAASENLGNESLLPVDLIGFIDIFDSMKAISLLQPWASLVVMGIKTIETRNWATKHRGTILIHAGKSKAGSIFADDLPIKKHIYDFYKLPFGACIGKVEIVDIIPADKLEVSLDEMDTLTYERKAFGEYSDKRYAWILENASMLKTPISMSGMMSVWEVPSGFLELLNWSE